MSGNVMPKEQAEFINDLKEQMLVNTNMTENEAYDFAFRVWQHQDFLHWYIEMKWSDDNDYCSYGERKDEEDENI